MENNIKNEFEGVETEDVPETEFSDVPEDTKSSESDFDELMPDDFQQENYLKNPEVDKTIILTVEKVGSNKKTEGKNKTTGETFTIGLKKKDGSIMRHDMKCEEGVYTISAWEIFFKLFGTEGILTKYGKVHNTFKGCKLSITRNYDGSYAHKKIPEIQKLMDMTPEKAEAYQKEVGQAFKDSKLYTVRDLNMPAEVVEEVKADKPAEETKEAKPAVDINKL